MQQVTRQHGTNFWDFVHIYLDHRFIDDYCLSAESSLDLHIENPTEQVIVITKQGTGLRKLMYETSLLDMQILKIFRRKNKKTKY